MVDALFTKMSGLRGSQPDGNLVNLLWIGWLLTLYADMNYSPQQKKNSSANNALKWRKPTGLDGLSTELFILAPVYSYFVFEITRHPNSFKVYYPRER